MKILALAVFVILIQASAFASDRITIYQDKENPAQARSVARRAEKILQSLEEKFLSAPIGPIKIFVASSKESFLKAQAPGANVPVWAAGTAYPDSNLIIIKSNKAAPGQDQNLVLSHELAHLVLGRIFTSASVPRWLQEGLAMHISGEWGLARQVAMSRAVVYKDLIPLDRLKSGFPDDLIGIETAYAESYYFLAFLKQKYGKAAVYKMVFHLGRGVRFENALLKISGKPWEYLEADFFKWLSIRFSLFSIVTGSGFIWFLAAVIVIPAWIRKKVQTSRKMALWDLEEKAVPETKTRH